jgi:hypothetical protein
MIKLTKSASEFMSAFDGAVDNFCTSGVSFDVNKLLVQFNLKHKDIAQVQAKVQKTTEELELLVIDADEQITEGYSNLSKQQQRELLAIYHTLMEVPSTKPRVEREDSDLVRTPRKPKVVVEKTSENYDAVFTVCSKYNAVRAFVGNVVVTGRNVSADEIYETKFGKKVNVMSVQGMTKDEILAFIQTGNRASRTSTTLSGATIDLIIKF